MGLTPEQIIAKEWQNAAAVLQNVIVNELSDLDILRKIRDANPTSQLPSLWLDTEDPYTQWEGLIWSATAPSSSTTAWEYSFTSHTTASSIWYCKVTDSAGNTANSQNISVTLSCTT